MGLREYIEKQWEEETSLSEYHIQCLRWGLGSCTLRCPECKTLGFYNPREDKNSGRKYRACKFCGFWQEVSGKIFTERGSQPYRCAMIYCDKCRVYNWMLPWAKIGNCKECGNFYREVRWPSDDPDHPYNKIKEQMDMMHGIK